MLYNIPCRIYILSTLSLCISGIVSTATATSSETKISNEETLVVTTNRSASNLWESDAPRDKCTLSCAINGIHAAFHYLKKNYISGCVMTVPTG